MSSYVPNVFRCIPVPLTSKFAQSKSQLQGLPNFQIGTLILSIVYETPNQPKFEQFFEAKPSDRKTLLCTCPISFDWAGVGGHGRIAAPLSPLITSPISLASKYQAVV